MRKKSGDEDGSYSKRKGSEKKQQKPKQISGKPPKIPKYSFANLKNQIQNHVNTKKIVQFVRKSSRSIPNLLTKQQSKALLPKLEKIILSDLNNADSRINKIKFEQIESQLTHSMVMFKQTTQSESHDLWAIDMQTQKCYKMIPPFYFKQHMNLQQLTRNLTLTKNYNQMQQSIYSLMDYLDQVEFNINQQAAAKIKMFMNFVMCMNTIQDLVNISAQKISATRKHTGILRDIVVSRSIRINQHRMKKQNIKQTLDVLMIFKKMKTIENKLSAQISLGNFISHDQKTKLGALFTQYCHIHNIELKKFCCKTGKHLCKYWDITYFVQKGYQDNFMKMVRSYLFEIVNCQLQIQNFKKAFIINKKNFMTTPSNSSHAQVSHNILDESYQVDAYDHVELITKIHIQREIISIFQQGVQKYSFETDNLQRDLANFISTYINSFLREVLNYIDADPRQTLRDLNQAHETNYYESQKCKEKIFKISWVYFDKIIEMLMLRFQYLNIRLFSLIQKILVQVKQLQKQDFNKFSSICVFMGKLNVSLVLQIDSYLCSILKHRIRQVEKSITLFKSKQDIMKELDGQSQTMKRLVKHCTKWLKHIQSIQKTYPLCKEQTNKMINNNQKQVHVKMDEWSPRVSSLKGNLVKNTYQLLHKTFISRDLREKLEEQTWQFVEVKTQIYNDLGYIIGGRQFVVEDERNQRDLLSNSLLMQRSMSEMQKSQAQHQYNKEQYSSKFKINPNYITIGNLKFKIISSTEHMIKMLRKYLQLYDDYIDNNKKQDLLAKLTELILMYNQYIKDLIVKGDAIKLGKIKTKSITAKQLIIAYIQLQVIDVIYSAQIIQNRIGLSKQNCLVMHQKILSTEQQIRKKYQKIMEMRIMDAIEAINIKDQNVLQNQHLSTIPKNYQASIDLFGDLMLPQYEFEKFIDIEPNWAAQLVNKVGKGPKGKDLKLKYFSLLEQQVKAYSKYLPKLITAIKSVLY